MTDLQDDLTGAFERRAGAAIVEDHLDAILTGTNVIRLSRDDEPSRRGGILLALAASAAVIVGAAGLVWATAVRSDRPASPASSESPVAEPVGRVPADFPSEVPRPDAFESMQVMWWDDSPVGLEFYDQGAPTDSVERCTKYASLFDQNWTSTAITGEAPEVLYARRFDNTRWDVSVLCSEDGSYLVQVMPIGTTPPINVYSDPTAPIATVDTVLAGSTDSDAPVGTAPPMGLDLSDKTVSGPPATIPEVFPDDVPQPDTFEFMQVMWWDDLPVGWEFYNQDRPTESAKRCTQYAASFGPDWASAAITDEAASVVYARTFTNAAWTVGIYCTDDGGYLVQVMPASS